MTKPLIILDNIYKSFSLSSHLKGGIKHFILHFPTAWQELRQNHHFEVLKGISFKIYNHETFGIIGPNGSGKSTTLGLIAGVLKPDRGEILVMGRVSALLELGAGFHPDLTGYENIILNGILLGLTKKEIKSKIEKIIEFSDLGQFIYEPIRTYSDGMLARLGFSVAIYVEPKILLIDEILAVGDVNFQKRCFDKITEFKKKGITIVFVSHNLDDVERICDRVALLNNGKVTYIGSPKDSIKKYIEIMETSSHKMQLFRSKTNN
jgi:lipopolysaccharide transport system ATP-binding protein